MEMTEPHATSGKNKTPLYNLLGHLKGEKKKKEGQGNEDAQYRNN